MQLQLPFGATLFAVAAILLACATETYAADAKQRTLSLTGRAEVTAAPDMATISAGIVTEEKSARKALNDNNAAMAGVLQTITSAGVADKDIQTSNFSIQPKYTYPPRSEDGAQKPPSIVGYTVSNDISVIVRDLSKLGSIMDAVVTSGANRMNRLSFSIADPEPLRNQARKAAVAEALARAKLYADAAGVSLGPILTISESAEVMPPRPMVMSRMAVQAAPEARVPVAEAEQVIKATVDIVWTLQ